MTGPFAPRGPIDYGAFYTPPRTAAHMVRLLAAGPADRVLDPCAGEGAFVAALLAAGVAADRITAWELDPRAVAALRRRFPGVRVVRRDALLGPDDGERFERVIANPPYLGKASAYVRAHRAALRERFADIGASEAYAMFLATGLDRLVPHGRLVFIVSDTLRTLGSHERLRRRILERHSLLSLGATPDGLFPGASVRAVVIAVGARPGGTTTRVLPRADGEDYAGGRWSTLPTRVFRAIDGAPFVLEAPRSIVRLFAAPRRLADVVDGHIGMHTRDNAASLAVCPAAVGGAPVRGGVRTIAAAAAHLPRWQPYLKEGGEKDFFFPVFEYVDWRPRSRARYVIPNGPCFGRAGLAVSGIAKRLSVRLMPAGCYWDTNKVIGLVPRRRSDTYLLLGLLTSDLYTYLAKRLINDTSSLQLHDLWKLPVPPIEPDAARRIAALAARCVRRRRRDLDGDLTDLRRALDREVYGALAISAVDRRTIARSLAAGG